jgi:hypothetical protein
MNTVLWAVQIVLAVKLVSVAYSHALRPDQTKMQRGLDRLGATARPLLILISLGSVLGAASLILPAAVRGLSWLIPWSAALLALCMLLGVGLHVGCREKPSIVPGLILCALAAFVGYGRWALAPF